MGSLPRHPPPHPRAGAIPHHGPLRAGEPPLSARPAAGSMGAGGGSAAAEERAPTFAEGTPRRREDRAAGVPQPGRGRDPQQSCPAVPGFPSVGGSALPQPLRPTAVPVLPLRRPQPQLPVHPGAAALQRRGFRARTGRSSLAVPSFLTSCSSAASRPSARAGLLPADPRGCCTPARI